MVSLLQIHFASFHDEVDLFTFLIPPIAPDNSLVTRTTGNFCRRFPDAFRAEHQYFQPAVSAGKSVPALG